MLQRALFFMAIIFSLVSCSKKVIIRLIKIQNWKTAPKESPCENCDSTYYTD